MEICWVGTDLQGGGRAYFKVFSCHSLDTRKIRNTVIITADRLAEIPSEYKSTALPLHHPAKQSFDVVLACLKIT
jgi:hypothetical protein